MRVEGLLDLGRKACREIIGDQRNFIFAIQLPAGPCSGHIALAQWPPRPSGAADTWAIIYGRDSRNCRDPPVDE
jgi:hypothetical protein